MWQFVFTLRNQDSLEYSFFESLLELSEEFLLLELLVGNNLGVGIVGEVGCPFNVGFSGGLISSGYSSQLDQSLDACHFVSRLSGDHLIPNGVSHLADLVDSNQPRGSVSVGNSEGGSDLTRISTLELGLLYLSRHDLGVVEGPEDRPCVAEVHRDDCRLDLVEGDGVFSRTILVFPNTTTGKYIFSFFARDKVGNFTVGAVDSIFILP